jgi:hypothetical protein
MISIAGIAEDAIKKVGNRLLSDKRPLLQAPPGKNFSREKNHSLKFAALATPQLCF